MPLAAVIAVFALVLGLAVLVLVTVTVFGQVKSLARTVARAAERIGATSDIQGPPRSE